ncbi:MAG: peptidoglycan DD-metalloendopeptidase family protein [Candidatus Brocadiaceae bacterium]|nr:peptidoglycan DD-metalloendopeptidase family protein [Candidatus Brocadiaceae bacterium]
MPVIVMAVAVVALSLAVWGLWIELDETTTTEIVTDHLITGEATPSNEPSQQLKRQELQLEFEHDRNSSNPENSQDNALKRNSQINKNTTTNKVNNNQELADTSISSQYTWNKTKIRSGDSMARVFKRLGFKPGDLHAIISLGKNTAILKKIKPGKMLEYSTQSNGELNAIRYEIDPLNTLVVIKTNDTWQETIETKKLEIRLTNSRGTIDSSLFLAGKKAGLTDAMVMSLAGIFGWDIDFILDIREGDSFTVIYEEKYVQGEKIGNGNILATEFVNQGKAYQAVRYQDTTGSSEYFTPAGMSMRKAFIRNPVDFSYISSKFNPRRYHPILKRVKAHNGVDYRAPKGTPVRSAGDGKVITSTYSKYNGHHVFIQHGQKYITKYLHFTKRKVRQGQRVKQGQVIGYVGSTGLAQAPHLHYEFLVNGVHRNPRTIKLPDAKPINKKEKGRFLTKTRELVKQLEIQKQVFSKSEETAE